MKEFKRRATELVNGFFDDEITTRSAALAFYTALGIAPLVVLVVVVLAIVGIDLQDAFIREINQSIGDEAGALLKTIISAANERPDLKSLSGILAICGLLISSSFIFVQLQDTLNLIFDVPKKDNSKATYFQMGKDFLLVRLLSLGMLMTFIFILIVSLMISTIISYISSETATIWLRILNFMISMGIFTLLFGLIFKWMPDRRITTKSAFKGGALTAVLFMIGKSLIGMYIANSAVGSAYGAAGSLMVTLVWVYYSALVIFIGAEASFISLVEYNPKEKIRLK